MKPRTIVEKIWDSHVVADRPGAPASLYVDLHLVHEVTSPQAFSTLRERGLKGRRADKTVAPLDHATPNDLRRANGPIVIQDAQAAAQVRALEQNCKDFGITLYDLDSERQGIVHVI